jgi:hypothetical protein
VIEAGLAGISPERARMILVRNTLALDRLWVSEALLSSVTATPTLEQVGPPRPLPYDPDGALAMPEWIE